MNWHKFSQTLKEKNISIFTRLDVKRIFQLSNAATNFLLHRYTKKNLIIRLKQGLYALTESNLNDLVLANKLYSPSYLSLEFALSFYSIIPEVVYELTSITSKTTRHFKLLNKIFSYRRIKKSAFTGYVPLRQNGNLFLIAEPEKAWVDWVYLKMLNGENTLDRWDKRKIKKKKALSYAQLFGNVYLLRRIKTLLS